MKYHFKNIGLIKEASIELGDLTILAGPNNTGKTYIAYTLYGFFATCSRYFSIVNGTDGIVKNFKSTLPGITDQYSRKLHEVFSAREQEFWNAEFSIETDDPMFSVDAMSRAVFDSIKSVIFSKPHICVSERLGIPLFYRDLDMRKLAVLEHLEKLNKNLQDRDTVLEFLEISKRTNARYALPIKDSIDFIRSIPDIIRDDSPPELAALSEYIVSMTGGVYRDQSAEGLVFASRPRSRAKFSLTTNLWSSSVKSLSNLFFYFKHAAKPGQLLIIDEPEIHLTPQNQIILARMLAACVNRGIKVLVTTHSDYLIKEFNNLIMLHNLPEEAQKTFIDPDRKGSPYKPDERLNPDRVKAYICQKGGKVTPCRMDRYGMEVATMDEAIRDINRRADALMERMDDAGHRE